MPVTYATWLVLLSIVMAIQGAYVGLSLAVQIAGAAGARRRLLLAGATVSFAVAIWTMHFVGMLAVRLPFQVDYLVLPTLLSFLVCAIVVGAAVYATCSGPLTLLRLTLSACLMGGGIFAMHYLGMRALDASALMVHDPVYVAASMAIAIAASGLALWLATGRGGRPPLVLSSVAFGVAVSGMHYTAMRGVTLYPFVTAASARRLCRPTSWPSSSRSSASASPGYSFCCCCRMRPGDATGARGREQRGRDARGPGSRGNAAGDTGCHDGGTAIEFGRGTFSPLGGAGAPPRRFARHLPIERDGGTHFLAVEQVVAIHANAHYTYVFDGNDKLFCPLAIGDVELRLDGSRFVRVHRSHIVNIDRVVGYKRSGDNEMVEMGGVHHYLVPVSRSRIGTLKSRVASLNGADPAFAPRRRHRLAAQ